MKTTRLWIALLLGTSLGAPAYAQENLTFGVEGFYDNYREPGVGLDVNEHARFGSITAGYFYGGTTNYFANLDGRISYGRDDYRSVDGTVGDIPQYEGELRWRGGTMMRVGSGTFMPYIGVGGRFFYDDAEGKVTNKNKYGYDRRIVQAYLPVGATYAFTAGSWTITPTAEYDVFLGGKVNSRLMSLTGYNVKNNQSAFTGYGLRGEFMVGKKATGYSWEVGPFVRYWNIKNSELTISPDFRVWEEPKNIRLQTGGAFRLKF